MWMSAFSIHYVDTCSFRSPQALQRQLQLLKFVESVTGKYVAAFTTPGMSMTSLIYGSHSSMTSVAMTTDFALAGCATGCG